MIASMTGYGEAIAEAGGARFRVSARSVNHRFVEVRFRAPRDLSSLEHDVGAKVRAALLRGQVEVAIAPLSSSRTAAAPRFDAEAASTLISEARVFAARSGLSGQLTLADVLGLPGVVTPSEDEPATPTAPVLAAVDQALKALVEMRHSEGGRLAADLQTRLRTLALLTEHIERRGAESAPERHQRLLRRVQAVLREARMEGEGAFRIEQELVQLVERSDVTEELVRARSHLEAFGAALQSGERAPGKKLEFLIQELGREFNTIGSKSADIETTQAVVDAKVELERIREQVSNLE